MRQILSSSRGPQQRFEVADGPEMRQLVGVRDSSDAVDLAAGDVERHHADQPLLWVEVERSGGAVDLDRPEGDARNTARPADPVDDRARDAVAAV